jgi:hypothetical protein
VWRARKPDCRWRTAADPAVGCLPATLSLLYRAAGQSLTGILANDPEEAVPGDHHRRPRRHLSGDCRHDLLAEHVLAGLQPGNTP